MRLGLAIEGNLQEILERQIEDVKGALKSGVRETVDDGKQILRDQVTGAGLGNRLAKTWRSETYPKGTTQSLEPAGVVYSKAPQIIRSFESNELIRSKDGFWLAIPTEFAPKRGVGGKRISPSNFPEGRYGKLRFVYRQSPPSLLVVDGVRVGKNGRASRKLKNGGRNKNGDFGKGVATVVMFFLVPQVRMPRRLNIQTVRRRMEQQLPRNLVKHLGRLDDHV